LPVSAILSCSEPFERFYCRRARSMFTDVQVTIADLLNVGGSKYGIPLTQTGNWLVQS